VDLVGLILA